MISATDWFFLVFSIAYVEIGGLVSSLLGTVNYGTFDKDEWYQRLKKPTNYPSPGVFGVAWAILYAAYGVAFWLYLTYTYDPANVLAVTAQCFFFIHIVINFAWYPVFRARYLRVALFILLLLVATDAIMIGLTFATNAIAAGVLLSVYCAWLLFATYLNASIVSNN
jgi:benzodiazapine receptor